MASESRTLRAAWWAFWFWVGIDPGLSVLMRQNLILHDVVSIGVMTMLAGWVLLASGRLIAFRLTGVSLLVLLVNAVNFVSVMFSPVAFESPARIYGPMLSWFAASIVVLVLARGEDRGDLLMRMGTAYVLGTVVTVLSPLAVYHLHFLEIRYGLSALDPNIVGFRAAFALVFVLGGGIGWPVNQVQGWLASLFVATLILSFSKTALVGAAAGLGALWLMSGRRMSLGRRLAQLAAMLIPLVFFWDRLVGDVTAYVGNPELLDTLSGRTLLWQIVLDMSSVHPWLGYGFQTFREVIDPVSGIWNTQIVHAHNAYLTALLQVGYVGAGLIVLLTGTVAWQLVRLVRRRREPPVPMWTALVLMLLIRSLTEGTFGGSTPEFAMLAALGLIGEQLVSEIRVPSPVRAQRPAGRRLAAGYRWAR